MRGFIHFLLAATFGLLGLVAIINPSLIATDDAALVFRIVGVMALVVAILSFRKVGGSMDWAIALVPVIGYLGWVALESLNLYVVLTLVYFCVLAAYLFFDGRRLSRIVGARRHV